MSTGSERLTGNIQRAYPFREDSPGLTATPGFPMDVVIDAYTDGPDPCTPYLASVEATSDYLLFNVTAGVYTMTVGVTLATMTDLAVPEFAVAQMLSCTPPLPTGMEFTVRLLVHKKNAYSLYTVLAGGTRTFDPTALPFEACTFNQTAPSVQALYGTVDNVFSGSGFSGDSQAFHSTDDVRIAAGYNIDLVTAPGQDDTTEVTITASPGLGLGVVDCGALGNPASLKLPLGLQPDQAGNIQIEDPNGCYNFSFVWTDLEHRIGTMFVSNDCTACCTCEDYTHVLAATRKSANRVITDKEDAMAAYALYQYGVDIYNKWVKARNLPTLTLRGMRGPEPVIAIDHTPVSGSPNYGRFVLTLTNNAKLRPSRVHLVGLRFVITDPIEGLIGDCTVMPPSGPGVKLVLAGDTPVDYYLNSGESISVTIVTHVPLDKWTGKWQATARATVQMNGSTVSQYLMATCELN